MLSGSRTSQRTKSGPAPSGGVRPHTTTSAPYSRNTDAIPAPTPRAPPVTSTTAPSKDSSRVATNTSAHRPHPKLEHVSIRDKVDELGLPGVSRNTYSEVSPSATTRSTFMAAPSAHTPSAHPYNVTADPDTDTIAGLLRRNATEFADLPALTSLDVDGAPTHTWAQL